MSSETLDGAHAADNNSDIATSLLDQLAADDGVPLNRQDLSVVLTEPLSFTGAAVNQVSNVVSQARAIADRYPTAARQQPELRL